MLLRNATLLHLDPPGVERATLRIEGGTIREKAPDIAPHPGEPIENLDGRVVMPGLVVGHHHLYSSLARGMPVPPSGASDCGTKQPESFDRMLARVWWRLDAALDDEAVYTSALVGAAAAAACGVTTVVDHHASPSCLDGSLDRVRRGLDDVGLRGVLCYETTDRHGPEGRERGLAENDRFAREARGPRFAGMIGAHASFTLSDEALAGCARLADTHGCGVHLHLLEDPCDDALSLARYGRPAFARLEAAGLLRPGTLLCHGTHLPPTDAARAFEAGCRFAHCPRSNMNNGVGYAPLDALRQGAILGTDGIAGDLFEELRTAWFKSRDAHVVEAGALDVVGMLARSARFASRCLGVTLGRLEPGAEADLVFLDYDPPTPLESANAVGHWLFGLAARHVRTVWVAGRRVVDDGRVIRVHPERYGADARRVARDVWKRLETPRSNRPA